MNITTLGIDIAKNVFHLHGTDENGKVVLRKRLRREQLLAFMQNLPACLVGMEACGSAHYWARSLWWRSLLGKEVSELWPHGEINGATVCQAVC